MRESLFARLSSVVGFAREPKPSPHAKYLAPGIREAMMQDIIRALGREKLELETKLEKAEKQVKQLRRQLASALRVKIP